MHKLNVNVFGFLILFSLTSILAQNEHSIQIDGGVIIPRSSSNGLSTSIKYSYSLNQSFSFYVNTGYNYWDKFKIVYIVDMTPVQSKQIFSSYSSDNHALIPLYIGTQINVHSNKLFTSFLDFEIGYSFFKYDSYDNEKVIDINTSEIVSYDVIKASKKTVTDNLYGIGIGGGLFHPLTNTINLVVSYRLNSNFNSGKFGLFSAKGTYSTLVAGLNIKF